MLERLGRVCQSLFIDDCCRKNTIRETLYVKPPYFASKEETSDFLKYLKKDFVKRTQFFLLKDFVKITYVLVCGLCFVVGLGCAQVWLDWVGAVT